MSARGPIQDVLRTQAVWLTTRPDPRHQSPELAPRGRDWLTMAGWMTEAADLIDSLLDPENKLFLSHYAEQMERLEAELAAARNNGQFGVELLRAVDENVRLRSEIEQFQELVRRLVRQRNAACTVAERYVVDLPAELRQIYQPEESKQPAETFEPCSDPGCHTCFDAPDRPDLVGMLAAENLGATLTCTVCDDTVPADDWAFHVHSVPSSALEGGDLCGQGGRGEPACTLVAGHDGAHEQWETKP